MLENRLVYMEVDSVRRSDIYLGCFVIGKDLLSGSSVEIFVQDSALTPLEGGIYKFKRNLFDGVYVTYLLEYDELAWSPFVRAIYNLKKELTWSILAIGVIVSLFIWEE